MGNTKFNLGEVQLGEIQYIRVRASEMLGGDSRRLRRGYSAFLMRLLGAVARLEG